MRTTRFRGTGGTAGTSWRRTCRPHWSREDFGRIEKTCVLARHESRKLHPFRACRDPKDSYRIPTAYEYCAVLREEAKTLVSLADNSGRLPVQQHSRDRRTDWNDTSQKMETTEAFLHNFVYLLQNLIDIRQTSLRNTNRIVNRKHQCPVWRQKATLLLRTGGGLFSMFRQPSEEELIRSLVWQ